ncbi:MAG TPA: RNA polymerase factor sigma-54 [Candidatus Angelobacter sp.]|nr:RNA polymerase factor sigma-54 [Candidatus Angelobacter sp.]
MELKQTQQQQLKMAPMLLEAISLLQFNQLDLRSYLKEKALENPLIDYFEPEVRPVRVSQGGTSTTDIIENTLTPTISFREDLKQQVRLQLEKGQDADLLEAMIDDLDDKGYWVEETGEWAEAMGYPATEVQDALTQIRELEPAGVGAVNVQDCLLLQVERFSHGHQALLKKLIQDYLEQVAEENWDWLSEQLEVTEEELLEAYNQLKELTPYPVRGLDQEPVNYVVPDLTLDSAHGHYFLKLEQQSFPKLSINQSYYKELLGVGTAKDHTYVQRKYAEAEWLIKGLARREETLYKIAEVLTLTHGENLGTSPKNWGPLTLREVADELGIHESTVSRAIKEKVVKTPYGLLPLKAFFPKGMKRGTRLGYSVPQIKTMLFEQIQQEDKSHPLSDQALAEWFLKEKGVRLSRRVMAKYRGELNIESSMKRRSKEGKK